MVERAGHRRWATVSKEREEGKRRGMYKREKYHKKARGLETFHLSLNHYVMSLLFVSPGPKLLALCFLTATC